MDTPSLLARAVAWCADPANAPVIDHTGGTGFTATDVYNRVRADLLEQETGREYGTAGLSAGYGMGYRVPGATLEDVRTFLFRKVGSGELVTFHPGGKRTSTGLRYRLASAEPNAVDVARQQARDKKAKRGTVIHVPADATVPGYKTHPICRTAKAGPAKLTFSITRKKPTVYARGTTQPNCTHCLRKLVPAITPA